MVEGKAQHGQGAAKRPGMTGIPCIEHSGPLEPAQVDRIFPYDVGEVIEDEPPRKPTPIDQDREGQEQPETQQTEVPPQPMAATSAICHYTDSLQAKKAPEPGAVRYQARSGAFAGTGSIFAFRGALPYYGSASNLGFEKDLHRFTKYSSLANDFDLFIQYYPKT
jgi:hypothetical protein